MLWNSKFNDLNILAAPKKKKNQSKLIIPFSFSFLPFLVPFLWFVCIYNSLYQVIHVYIHLKQIFMWFQHTFAIKYKGLNTLIT